MLCCLANLLSDASVQPKHRCALACIGSPTLRVPRSQHTAFRGVEAHQRGRPLQVSPADHTSRGLLMASAAWPLSSGLYAIHSVKSDSSLCQGPEPHDGCIVATIPALSLLILLHPQSRVHTHRAVNAVRRGLNTHNFRPDFMTFNHRGTVLPHVLPDGHVLTASASTQ